METPTPQIKWVKLNALSFDEAIYPRKKHNPALVQKYAESLAEIEARGNYMSVATDLTLLDGRHRQLAYMTKRGDNLEGTVPVYCYPVDTEADKFGLAVELNSAHGDQLSLEDKRQCALRFYAQYHWAMEAIAKKVSVKKQAVVDWTKAIREEEERKLNETIFDRWLACWTEEEIAQAVSLDQSTVKRKLQVLCSEFPGTKSIKLSHFELERDARGEEKPDEYGWKRPLYNVWTWAAKTNETSHFGNSEQTILERLLYLYTDPFDIVVDPFAGGGSTIDVCRRRLRRYWASDRKPIVARKDEIRLMDVAKELPPLYKRWAEVALTYLDPPYWKQAEGRYSKDADDLANMPLDRFTSTLADIIKGVAKKQSRGAIALLMQPTQWHTNDEHDVTDHVLQLVEAAASKRLRLEYRISCPYSTEQCNAQMVQWARENRKLLVLTRELVVWRIVNAD